MTYRVREPLLAVRKEPGVSTVFFTIEPGAVFTVKGELQPSGFVDVLYEGQIILIFKKDIELRADRNYPLDVPVRYFARNRNGIIWAATSMGLWKFERSRWQQVGPEWNAPTGAVCQIAFDSDGTLWVLAGIDFGPMDLLYLKAGTKQFRTAAKSLLVLGFTLNAVQCYSAPLASQARIRGRSGHKPVSSLVTRSVGGCW